LLNKYFKSINSPVYLYDSNFLANSSKYYSLFVIIVLGLFKKSTTILIAISVGININ